MGAGEDTTPTKPSKPTSSAQEMPMTPSYPEWSSSMQAYYGAGATPPTFFAPSVASPTPHPYLWGSQHPLIPPYGTPVPYSALYPPGGVYAHPNLATPPSAAQVNPELEGKGPEGKDKASARKSKGASGNTVKAGESGKAASGSGNDGASPSAESGSEDSSDASDENNNQQEFASSKKGSFNQMLADANAQNNISGTSVQASVPGKPVISMPATNLNIGMDLWSSSPAGSGATKLRPNPSGISSSVAPAAMVGREGVMPDQWIQDERELKRQKRKQSNRESARRSRLRKQAECEELQAKVETLSTENNALRDELQRLSEECEKLTSENNSIKEELTRCGADAVAANLKEKNPTQLQSHGVAVNTEISS